MKKYISYLLLITSFILLGFSFNLYLKIHSFNHDSVKKNIDYLSSDAFKGRLAGSLENAEIAMYIKDSFKNNNLKPYNDSYFQSFQTIYPHKVSGTPYLNVTDKNGFLIREFKYGIDFKEDLLNFRKNTLSFNRNDKINLLNGHIQVKKDNDFFLFYTPENSELNFRSSFISTSPYSMYIMITKSTFNELNSYIGKDYNINCFIPFESKQASLNNVTAYIEGKDPKAPPIVLSAHFDHIGSDLSAKVYNGALDNASGVSFIIEMSKYINSIGKPDRNILFVGFNAEELGCLGSKAFADKYKNNLNGSRIFNFDMVGGSKSVPLYIMGGKQDTKDSPLIKEISAVCAKSKINFNYLFEDASDHEYFRKQNIDAVTLCDADSSRIHTPDDKPTFIDTSSIDRCFKVVSPEIIKYGFGKNLFILYNTELLFTSLFCTLLALILLYQNKNKKDI
ncbi:M28 family peptidase [Clostridium thailandense]|uniref:M28 family metallopeptidase n=1 Tax=Clostridium thailandense TaxID=2794346 RepID=UPI003988A64F